MPNSYIKVDWNHDFQDEPVLLLSELDSDRWETRKVEVFRDGRVGYASKEEEFGGTILGEKRTPSLFEIASDPQFEPVEITQEEFETAWAGRVRQFDAK